MLNLLSHKQEFMLIITVSQTLNPRTLWDSLHTNIKSRRQSLRILSGTLFSLVGSVADLGFGNMVFKMQECFARVKFLKAMYTVTVTTPTGGEFHR